MRPVYPKCGIVSRIWHGYFLALHKRRLLSYYKSYVPTNLHEENASRLRSNDLRRRPARSAKRTTQGRRRSDTMFCPISRAHNSFVASRGWRRATTTWETHQQTKNALSLVIPLRPSRSTKDSARNFEQGGVGKETELQNLIQSTPKYTLLY